MVNESKTFSLQQMQTRTAVVAAVVVLAALAAAVSPAEPTGLALWDAMLKAALASAAVGAASKAPRWAVMVFAVVAAAAGGLSIWGLLGFVGLAVGVGSALFEKRDRAVGAVVAALSAQTLLRLPAIGFFGLPSLIALGAFGLVLVTGYRYATKPQRLLVRRALSTGALLTLVIALVGGMSLLSARSDVDSGVAAARRGLSAARSGDTSGVVEELERAETSLDSANSRMRSAPIRILRLLPVGAQHQRSIEAATSAGALAAREAAATVRDSNIGAIALTAGSVDLAALQAMAPRLRATSSALGQAGLVIKASESPWVIAPIRDRIAELATEIEQLLPEVEIAADAAETLPAMLGVDRPQQYVAIFGTPAESRELGGFMGSWALLTFDQGRLTLGESGRVTDLYEIASTAPIEPGVASDWFLAMARPNQFPQNLTSSADFAQVAEISRQVIGGISEAPLDGFVYMDALALVEMLELTGPVTIPFQDEPLTSENGASFFFDAQYRFDPSQRTEIFDTLAVVARTVVDRMTQQTLPGPEELGRVLGPAARGGHLQVVTFDEGHNDFLRSVKLLRDFGRDATTDFVGVVQTNGLSNKMDLYLQRALDYMVDVDSEGAIRATASVTLQSVVPVDAPEFTLGQGETRGINRVLLSLYTPHALTGVSVNGAEVEFRSTVEFDLARYLVQLDVPPTSEPLVVEFSLSGVLPPDSPYSLKIWEQPLVNTDRVSVSYRGPDGAFTWEDDLHENVVLWAEELSE